MTKRMTLSLLTLAFMLGVSGTFIHAKDQLAANKEKSIEGKEQQIVFGFEAGDTPLGLPTIIGAKDWNIYQGEAVDVLAGVTAKDYQDNPVKVSASSFSTEEVGEHVVKLTAKDQFGFERTVEITVNVLAPKVESEEVVAEAVIEESVTEAVYENVSTTIVEEAPVTEVVTEQSQPSEPSLAPNTMYLGGIAISYANAGQGSGQSVIDSNPNMIATWGGAASQSGNDGASTHFIGHNPGIFSILFSLGGGSEIIVTDGAGTPTSYIVNQILQVDDYATRTDTGENISDQVIGAGGGERITLQTCINDDINLVVFASAV